MRVVRVCVALTAARVTQIRAQAWGGGLRAQLRAAASPVKPHSFQGAKTDAIVTRVVLSHVFSISGLRYSRLFRAGAAARCKGTEDGKVSAASTLANLIANSDANKKLVTAMPDVIPSILNMTTLSEKGAAVSARALLNLVSNKEAARVVCNIDGAVEKLAKLVLTGRMETKEDATRLLNTMVAHGKEACVQVAKCEQVLHALKSVARANNCTGDARLWALSALQVPLYILTCV